MRRTPLRRGIGAPHQCARTPKWLGGVVTGQCFELQSQACRVLFRTPSLSQPAACEDVSTGCARQHIHLVCEDGAPVSLTQKGLKVKVDGGSSKMSLAARNHLERTSLSTATSSVAAAAAADAAISTTTTARSMCVIMPGEIFPQWSNINNLEFKNND